MQLEYYVDISPVGTEQIQLDTYQFWVLLSGQAEVSDDKDQYKLQSREVLEIPYHHEISINVLQPCTWVKMVLMDTKIVNTRLLHHTGQPASVLTGTVMCALQLREIPLPLEKEINKDLEQLLHDLIVSMDIVISEMHPSVVQVISDISKHWMEPDYDLAAVIAATGYSPSHFRVLFKKETTQSPIRFLHQRRIEEAMKILKKSRDSVTVAELSEKCGFNDPFYFSKIFKQIAGISPNEYKLQLGKKETEDSEEIKEEKQ